VQPVLAHDRILPLALEHFWRSATAGLDVP
jgi:hypothetical protein